MAVTDDDKRLIAAIQDGLPLVARPYAAIADRLGLGERDVIAALRRLSEAGVISRFGVIVRHHELGYKANAMVVWDVPDADAPDAGRRLAELPFVTLCYRRPRRPPDWPYNLFAMIHGRDRAAVEALIEQATAVAGLQSHARDILFSGRRFKQRGARYVDSRQAEPAGCPAC